jgi:hypothetical protein
MSTVKISELPAAANANAGDELAANQAGTTRKLTRAQIVAGLAASGSVTASGLTMTTARILGRTTASTGAVEEISVGSGLTLSAGSLSGAPGSWVEISRATASNSTSIDFTGLTSDYELYRIDFYGVMFENDSRMLLRTSSDNGSTYDDSDDDNYVNYGYWQSGAGSSVTGQSSNDTRSFGFLTRNDIEETIAEPPYFEAFGSIDIILAGISGKTIIKAQIATNDNRYGLIDNTIITRRGTPVAVNAIRMYSQDGNINTGTFILLARRK